MAQGEGGRSPAGRCGCQPMQETEAIDENHRQRTEQNRGTAQKPLGVGNQRVGQVEDREGQQRVGGVQMLTPVPVDGLVFAEFEIAYQPELEQGVAGE